MDQFNDADFADTQDFEEIPTHIIDDALVVFRKAEQDRTEKKKIATDAFHVEETAKQKLFTLLQKAGKTRWEGTEGFVGVSISKKLKWRVPEGTIENEKFLNFLRSEQVSELMKQTPDEIFYHYAKVN